MLLDWSTPPPSPAPPDLPTPPPPEPPPLIAPTPPPELDRLRLGIVDSDQVSDNAMGFNDPSPHNAPQSEVEQPGLDPNAGPSTPPMPQPPGAPSTPVVTRPAPASPETSPPPTPTDATKAAPKGDSEADRAQQREAAKGDGRQPMDEPGDRPPEGEPEMRDAEPQQVVGKDVEVPESGEDLDTTEAQKVPSALPRPLADAIAEFVGPIAPPDGLPPTPVTPSPTTPPTDAPSESATDQVAPELRPPGLVSEKEADPSSKRKPIEVVLGRPAAAQGLEIITKRPRRNPFSLVTRVTAVPVSPVLEVKFNRAGTVSKAVVVKSSGIPDVDSPVLAAVYGWTARGKELAALPADDPDAGITVVVTILLR